MGERRGIARSVAGELRARILAGDLSDGTALPKYERLQAEFDVSMPTLREAMRILESEGLIVVLRGSRGGAVVQSPRDVNIAYTLGLVLESADTSLLDVANALQEIEPLCVKLCATRADRHATVVPALRKVHEAAMELLDDDEKFTAMGRRFHEVLAAECGNQTLRVLVGALVALWSGHEREWACEGGSGLPTSDERRAGTAAHARLIDLIEDGAADQAMTLARRHIGASQHAALARTSQQHVKSESVYHSGSARRTGDSA